MIADVCMTLLMDPISRVLAGQAARASEVRRFRHQVRVESYQIHELDTRVLDGSTAGMCNP